MYRLGTNDQNGAPGRPGKRRGTITAHDIEHLDIQEFTQELSTKGSYHSYSKAFVTWAIEEQLTSPRYCEAMKQDSDLTPEFVQEQKIRPICSSVNVENYLKIFQKEGRRRGTGVVTRPMADQFLKAASDLQTKEISKRLHEFQDQVWQTNNREFFLVGRGILRTQTIVSAIHKLLCPRLRLLLSPSRCRIPIVLAAACQ